MGKKGSGIICFLNLCLHLITTQVSAIKGTSLDKAPHWRKGMLPVSPRLEIILVKAHSKCLTKTFYLKEFLNVFWRERVQKDRCEVILLLKRKCIKLIWIRAFDITHTDLFFMSLVHNEGQCAEDSTGILVTEFCRSLHARTTLGILSVSLCLLSPDTHLDLESRRWDLGFSIDTFIAYKHWNMWIYIKISMHVQLKLSFCCRMGYRPLFPYSVASRDRENASERHLWSDCAKGCTASPTKVLEIISKNKHLIKIKNFCSMKNIVVNMTI